MPEKLIKTGVIGYPIQHSKSPLIHGYWFKQHGIAGEYGKTEIVPDLLHEGTSVLIYQGYQGFNVTVPHKVAIMSLCDEVDALARTIGAVNTVTIKDGRLYGTNTDAYGFVENIRQNAPEGWDFADKSALVLGAGGAAKAAVYALVDAGVRDVLISNRTRQKAEDLATPHGHAVRVVDWNDRHAACADVGLIANTTSLGMDGQPPLDLDLSAAPAGCIVHDIVYAPLMTDLLVQARQRGLPIVTGIGMLLHQARPGFELWTGVLPDVDEALEKHVLG